MCVPGSSPEKFKCICAELEFLAYDRLTCVRSLGEISEFTLPVVEKISVTQMTRGIANDDVLTTVRTAVLGKIAETRENMENLGNEVTVTITDRKLDVKFSSDEKMAGLSEKSVEMEESVGSDENERQDNAEPPENTENPENAENSKNTDIQTENSDFSAKTLPATLETTTTTPYKLPIFQNCEDIEIPIPKTEAFIILSKSHMKVTAWDYLDNQIQLQSKAYGKLLNLGIHKFSAVLSATDSLNKTVVCRVGISVIDKSAPTMKDCPNDQYIDTYSYDRTAFVTWLTPSFSDNSGEPVVVKNNGKKPGVYRVVAKIWTLSVHCPVFGVKHVFWGRFRSNRVISGNF